MHKVVFQMLDLVPFCGRIWTCLEATHTSVARKGQMRKHREGLLESADNALWLHLWSCCLQLILEKAWVQERREIYILEKNTANISLDTCIHLQMASKQNSIAFISLTASKANPFFKHAEECYVGERYYFSKEAMFRTVKFSSHIEKGLAFCTQGHRLFIFNMWHLAFWIISLANYQCLGEMWNFCHWGIKRKTKTKYIAEHWKVL